MKKISLFIIVMLMTISQQVYSLSYGINNGDSSKLKVDMSESSVLSMFGNPDHSEINSCGKKPEEWNCKVVNYKSKDENSDLFILFYKKNNNWYVNNWNVENNSNNGIYLECVVSGDIRYTELDRLIPSKSREIRNEVVNVEVSKYKKSTIFIEVKGSKDLELGVSTKPTKSTVKIENHSSDNSFQIKNIGKIKDGDFVTNGEQEIRIDRVSGKLYVDETISTLNIVTIKTKYMGTCQSLDNRNKF